MGPRLEEVGKCRACGERIPRAYARAIIWFRPSRARMEEAAQKSYPGAVQCVDGRIGKRAPSRERSMSSGDGESLEATPHRKVVVPLSTGRKRARSSPSSAAATTSPSSSATTSQSTTPVYVTDREDASVVTIHSEDSVPDMEDIEVAYAGKEAEGAVWVDDVTPADDRQLGSPQRSPLSNFIFWIDPKQQERAYRRGDVPQTPMRRASDDAAQTPVHETQRNLVRQLQDDFVSTAAMTEGEPPSPGGPEGNSPPPPTATPAEALRPMQAHGMQALFDVDKRSGEFFWVDSSRLHEMTESDVGPLLAEHAPELLTFSVPGHDGGVYATLLVHWRGSHLWFYVHVHHANEAADHINRQTKTTLYTRSSKKISLAANLTKEAGKLDTYEARLAGARAKGRAGRVEKARRSVNTVRQNMTNVIAYMVPDRDLKNEASRRPGIFFGRASYVTRTPLSIIQGVLYAIYKLAAYQFSDSAAFRAASPILRMWKTARLHPRHMSAQRRKKPYIFVYQIYDVDQSVADYHLYDYEMSQIAAGSYNILLDTPSTYAFRVLGPAFNNYTRFMILGIPTEIPQVVDDEGTVRAATRAVSRVLFGSSNTRVRDHGSIMSHVAPEMTFRCMGGVQPAHPYVRNSHISLDIRVSADYHGSFGGGGRNFIGFNLQLAFDTATGQVDALYWLGSSRWKSTHFYAAPMDRVRADDEIIAESQEVGVKTWTFSDPLAKQKIVDGEELFDNGQVVYRSVHADGQGAASGDNPQASAVEAILMTYIAAALRDVTDPSTLTYGVAIRAQSSALTHHAIAHNADPRNAKTGVIYDTRPIIMLFNMKKKDARNGLFYGIAYKNERANHPSAHAAVLFYANLVRAATAIDDRIVLTNRNSLVPDIAGLYTGAPAPGPRAGDAASDDGRGKGEAVAGDAAADGGGDAPDLQAMLEALRHPADPVPIRL